MVIASMPLFLFLWNMVKPDNQKYLAIKRRKSVRNYWIRPGKNRYWWENFAWRKFYFELESPWKKQLYFIIFLKEITLWFFRHFSSKKKHLFVVTITVLSAEVFKLILKINVERKECSYYIVKYCETERKAIRYDVNMA